MGSGKKRAREDEEPTPGQSAIVISDDDDESRARAITRKARLDPFAAKPKKKARADPSISQVAPPPAEATASPSKPIPISKISDVEEIPRPKGLASPTLKKRKKKKKHKSHAGAEPDVPPAANGSPLHPSSPSHLRSESHLNSPPQHNGVSATPKPTAPRAKEREVIVIKDTPPPEAPQPQSLLSAALSSARLFFSSEFRVQSLSPASPSFEPCSKRMVDRWILQKLCLLTAPSLLQLVRVHRPLLPGPNHRSHSRSYRRLRDVWIHLATRC